MGNGVTYRGTYSLTTSRASCLPWNSMILMGKSYTAWRTNSQALGLGRHNYCRYVAQGSPGSKGVRSQQRGLPGILSRKKDSEAGEMA